MMPYSLSGSVQAARHTICGPGGIHGVAGADEGYCRQATAIDAPCAGMDIFRKTYLSGAPA